MKLQMNTHNLACLFEEFNDITQLSNQEEPYHQMYSIPSGSGKVHLQRICLRNGMEINWFDGKLDEPVTFDIGVQYPHLEIAYTLEGRGYWEVAGQSRSYDLSPGGSTLLFMHDKKLHAELAPAKQMLQMELRIDIRYLRELQPELARLSSEPFICRQTAGSPQISFIVEQMIHCPYSGTLKKLYLEGKAFELLAYHLNGAMQGEEQVRAASRLKADDIRSLHQAKEILSHMWKEPPSLLELARLVGLNDYKLKFGFKHLFGTTVFGYVRGLRMNEARKILEQGIGNVSEAALMVGYHNLSHFSTLFRKTYGYNPSEIGKTANFTTDQERHSKESVSR
ncbi:AraC family transcriptional regulator [Brevibacillus ruminantium]|uniref:AraC family transcriptional regulator n=1 Tax=Brevibacillus ruminantium TaxID=2950604 RepID=A0ABY4WJZ2_9BACL|nr:AraC family transcriptional regulator [Brevibacillus ruminantium]USG67019.1 AraC family transcriptional regulator [Brevibacillus ruminantium]